MKKLCTAFAIVLFVASQAQVTANRFFYELTYAPNKDSLEKTNKEMMILDITKDKSIYRDYLSVSQDSILKVQIEAMQKSGNFKDISKTIKQPKFTNVITKTYPSMETEYADYILQDRVGCCAVTVCVASWTTTRSPPLCAARPATRRWHSWSRQLTPPVA